VADASAPHPGRGDAAGATPGESPPTPLSTADDALAAVFGQPEAVALLRGALRNPVHAYLLVGPAGSGSRDAALGFAAELLAADALAAGDVEAARRHRRLALAEAHPDLSVTEREGPFITRDQARAIVSLAARSPAEGSRKVLLLTEFHLVTDAAPILLKAIEEPPPSTFFVILADEVPPELVTIASRCMVVRFAPLPPAMVVERLVAEGAEADAAARAAEAAGGDLARARLLVADAGLGERAARWAAVPDRLDGTGANVVATAVELLASLEEALAPIDARHAAELAEAAAQEERYGLRPRRKPLEDRHRRERRRFRTDELRFGLGVLARSYRDRLAADGAVAPALEVFAAIQQAAEALERNPNERLLLERLLVRLSMPASPKAAGTAPATGRRRAG
jgi:DNA polymerase-3 subunit delta'